MCRTEVCKISTIVVLKLILLKALCSHGQTHVYADFSVGYAVNASGFNLGQERVVNMHGTSLQSGLYANFALSSKWFFETGLYGKYIFTAGQVGFSRYKAHSYKFFVPLNSGYQINPQWRLMGGVGIKNNRDLQNFHIRSSHNLRYDLMIRSSYLNGSRWHLNAAIMYNPFLPRVYLVSDPHLALIFGISYSLFQSPQSRNN